MRSYVSNISVLLIYLGAAFDIIEVEGMPLIYDPQTIGLLTILRKIQSSRIAFSRLMQVGDLEIVAELTRCGVGAGILPTSSWRGAPTCRLPTYTRRFLAARLWVSVIGVRRQRRRAVGRSLSRSRKSAANFNFGDTDGNVIWSTAEP